MANRAQYGAVQAAVIAGHEHGLSVNDIAKLHGFNMRSIRSAAKDLSIALRRERKPFGSAKALVYEAHAHGMTVPQLAEASGFSRHTLYTAFRRYGITLLRPRQGRLTP